MNTEKLSNSMAMGKRYNELRSEGKSVQEAADIVNGEFRTNIREGTLRVHGSQYKKRYGQGQAGQAESEYTEHTEQAGPVERAEHPEHSEDSAQQAPPSERPEQSEHDIDDIDSRIRQIASEVCQTMIQNIKNELNEVISSVQNVVNIPNGEDRPPEPTVTGRKENRIYEKLGATVDVVLFKKFMAEAKQRSVSVGKLIDLILWHRYGRPALSSELPEDEQEKLRGEMDKKKKGR